MRRIASLIVFVVLPVSGQDERPDASKLMERSRSTLLLNGVEMEVKVELRTASGTIRTRILEVTSRLHEDGLSVSRVSRFISPPDAKGIASLLVENSDGDDDVWIYLPALKKTRRVIADGKKERYMGTVLSFGDVLGHRPDRWNHTLIGEVQWEGHPCWSVESVPIDNIAAEESGYSRRVSCIDKDTAFNWKMDTWDLKGRPSKSIMNLGIITVPEQPGAFSYRVTEAKDLQSGETSSLSVSKFRYIRSPSVDAFSSAALAGED